MQLVELSLFINREDSQGCLEHITERSGLHVQQGCQAALQSLAMAQKGAVWPVVGWQGDIDPVDSTVLPVEVTLANWTRLTGVLVRCCRQ